MVQLIQIFTVICGEINTSGNRVNCGEVNCTLIDDNGDPITANISGNTASFIAHLAIQVLQNMVSSIDDAPLTDISDVPISFKVPGTMIVDNANNYLWVYTGINQNVNDGWLRFITVEDVNTPG
jgi:hypothetical protein